MVKAAVRESDRRPVRVHQAQPGFGFDAADARDGHACLPAGSHHGTARLSRCLLYTSDAADERG